MFDAVSKQLTQSLIDNNTIKDEERDIYRYGIQQGLTIILNFVTTLTIGLLCDMLWESVFFTVLYIPLRSFAGGYHAKTPIRCYIFSIALMLAVLLAMRFIIFTGLICGILLLISGVVIFLLAPVEDKNKCLDKLEQKVYRKRTLKVWVSELAVSIVCLGFKIMSVAECLTMVMTVMSVMLLLGQLKNMSQR